MPEIAFLSSLYIAGILFGFLFVPKIPARFVQLSAFLWGVSIWVIISILTITITRLSDIRVLFSLLGMSIVILIVLHKKQKTWQRNPKMLPQVGISLGVFMLLASGLYILRGIAGSPDSIYMVMISKIIATDGFFGHWTMGSPAWFGIILPLLNLPAWTFHQEYLYSLQPFFLISLVGTYLYFGFRFFAHSGSKNNFNRALILLSSIWLVCTPLIFFQMFYIHDNIISAVFLFLAFMTAWSLVLENNLVWLPFVMLSLTGFSLSRVESPVFSLIFLVVILSCGKISYRVRLYSIFPYLILISFWYLAISTMQIQVYMITLTRTSLLAIVSVHAAFTGFILLSGIPWIEKRIMPNLHLIILAAMLPVTGFLYYLDPALMAENLRVIYNNLWTNGGWGYIWPLAMLWLLFVVNTRISYERIFGFGGSLYFLFVVLLGSLREPSHTAVIRDPYHIRWSDSANRMFTSLLPILLFYALVKTMEYMNRKISTPGKGSTQEALDTYTVLPE